MRGAVFGGGTKTNMGTSSRRGEDGDREGEWGERKGERKGRGKIDHGPERL